MKMRPHDSNVVEVRVKPPEGFPNFPLTSRDSSSSSSTTVVRTVSRWAFNNYVDRFLAYFDHPLTSSRQFIY